MTVYCINNKSRNTYILQYCFDKIWYNVTCTSIFLILLLHIAVLTPAGLTYSIFTNPMCNLILYGKKSIRQIMVLFYLFVNLYITSIHFNFKGIQCSYLNCHSISSLLSLELMRFYRILHHTTFVPGMLWNKGKTNSEVFIKTFAKYFSNSSFLSKRIDLVSFTSL